MSRAQALADLAAAASSSEILGQTVAINGVDKTATKVTLPREKAEEWGADSLRQEVVSVAGSLADIGFVPVERSVVNIDGHNYEIVSSRARGDFLKFVGTRYLG